MHLIIYIICRAHSRRIRRNFFRRRFRDTQPKTRVPRIRFLRFISRTTFCAALLYVPSIKWVAFRDRVISARCTWPTLTFRISRRRLTETRIYSPGYENVRLNPPRVLIQLTERAPELSMVLSQVFIWIII